MKIISLISAIILSTFNMLAQNDLSLGIAASPMTSSYGIAASGDFKLISIGSKSHIGVGGIVCGLSRSDVDNQGTDKKSTDFYVAPQAGLHYNLTKDFDCFLKGGAGWVFSNRSKTGGFFSYNFAVGTSCYFSRIVGLRVAIGLPYSVIGVTFRL